MQKQMAHKENDSSLKVTQHKPRMIDQDPDLMPSKLFQSIPLWPLSELCFYLWGVPESLARHRLFLHVSARQSFLTLGYIVFSRSFSSHPSLFNIGTWRWVGTWGLAWRDHADQKDNEPAARVLGPACWIPMEKKIRSTVVETDAPTCIVLFPNSFFTHPQSFLSVAAGQVSDEPLSRLPL